MGVVQVCSIDLWLKDSHCCTDAGKREIPVVAGAAPGEHRVFSSWLVPTGHSNTNINQEPAEFTDIAASLCISQRAG